MGKGRRPRPLLQVPKMHFTNFFVHIFIIFLLFLALYLQIFAIMKHCKRYKKACKHFHRSPFFWVISKYLSISRSDDFLAFRHKALLVVIMFSHVSDFPYHPEEGSTAATLTKWLGILATHLCELFYYSSKVWEENYQNKY